MRHGWHENWNSGHATACAHYFCWAECTMKWGLKMLEISPETIQTEDNLLHCSRMPTESTPRVPWCFSIKLPNFMRWLELKKDLPFFFVLHPWRPSKHNKLWLRFTTLIMLHLWHTSRYKWQNENHCIQQWCIHWHHCTQMKVAIDTNGHRSVTWIILCSAESTWFYLNDK